MTGVPQTPRSRRTRLVRQVRWRGLQLLAAAHAALPRRHSSRIQVLLECRNPLMANYVLHAYATVADDTTTGGFITDFPERTARHDARAASMGLRWISRRRAIWRRWTLVLLANHEPLTYPPSSAKIIISHGPDHSRVVKGGSYYYDAERVLWPDGSAVYDLMLESSDRSAARGAAHVPDLAARIRVVGDVVADSLLEEAASAAPRDPDAPLRVAVMSTWGPHGLVVRHSDWLFPLVTELAASRTCEFVLTMHTNLWNPERSGTSRWRDAAQALAGPGVVVVEPDDDWAPLLPHTDVAVSDHTSLAAIYSVLGKPIVPVHVPAGIVNPESFSGWVFGTHAPVTDRESLLEALSHLDRYDLTGAPRVFDHLGRGRTLTAQAIREVMS